MFEAAIEKVGGFTRPIFTICRNYGSSIVQAGAASLFFINAEGWAVTCRHVVEVLLTAKKLEKHREAFLQEIADGGGSSVPRKLRRQLETKYRWSKSSTYELDTRFIDCTDGPQVNVEVRLHPTLDLALIKFQGFNNLRCTTFPTFPADSELLKPGKFICRLGFPFAEFNNYRIDPATDSLQWTTQGRTGSPRFPIEGMMTRNLINETGTIGFELSTPGLRGQSGGPAFDSDGVIWGVQSSTAHLDLDFDVDQEVIRSGTKKKVHDNAFLHVGHCVHVNVLKTFMREHAVTFTQRADPNVSAGAASAR